MKIRQKKYFPRRESGMATVIFIALLAIMLITAESSALFRLHREVKLIEQQQIKRLNLSQTNVTATVSLTEKSAAR